MKYIRTFAVYAIITKYGIIKFLATVTVYIRTYVPYLDWGKYVYR